MPRSEPGGDAPDLRLVTGAENDVYRLLNPRSVAVIGASSRPGSLAWWPLHLLQHCGFDGKLFPINPKRSEVNGLATNPSIGDVGEHVDVAVIPLNAQATFEAVAECAAASVGSLVLPTQGFSELGPEGRAQEQRLIDLARSAGMRVVGPNTDGVANLVSGAVMSIQPLFEESITPGPVAVVAQSGATAASLMVRLQKHGIGVKLSASAGNEGDLGLVDYMSVMLQDPEIRMVVSFVEAVRRPQDFYRVAELAAELDKPIALLKVGRSEQGVRRASAHTGALAGSDQIYDSVFEKYGVIRVGELSELVAVAKTYLSVGPLRNSGIGVISGSGGQAGAAADYAVAAGLPVPALTTQSETAIDELLTFGAGFNPCDLTGEIATRPELAAQVYEQFSTNEAIGTVVYIRKKLLGDVSERSVGPLVEASRQPGAAPLVVYAMDGFVGGVEADLYRDAGTPVFDSLSEIYTAVRGLAGRTRALTRLQNRAEEPVAPRSAAGLSIVGGTLDPATTQELLRRYELPRPAETFAADVDAAVAAAEVIGYPVVLKISDARIAHKTEIGGVVIGLADADDVRQAAVTVLERGRQALGGSPPDGVVVQEQVVGGIELIAGIKVDPDFGSFVLLGLGGVSAELLKDVTLRLAPLTPSDVVEMIGELRSGPLLHGYRNTPKSDVAALAEAVSRFSLLGRDYEKDLLEADLNPIVVLAEGHGVRVLDALIVGRS